MGEELETRLEKALVAGDRRDKEHWQFLSVTLHKDIAEQAAKNWRLTGHNARVVPRTLKAFGLSTTMYVVLIATRAPQGK